MLVESKQPEMCLLRAEDVARVLQISARTLWNMTKKPEFPKPVRFSARCVRWRMEEIYAYLDGVTRGPRNETLCDVAATGEEATELNERTTDER